MHIQLCFSCKTDEDSKKIIEKMRTLKNNLDNEYNDDYTIHSCHLTKKIIEEKGFSPLIVDAFSDIFGDKYVCEVEANNFDDAIANMDEYRKKTAQKVDRLIILTNGEFLPLIEEGASYCLILD